MTGVNILIGFVILLGFLPLALFLNSKRLTDRILKTGYRVQASVYDKTLHRKTNTETVYYHFIAHDGRQYQGTLKTKRGAHRLHDQIEVYYLPTYPSENTVKGKWGSTGVLIFMVLIGVWITYMMVQLYKMVNP